MSINSTVTSTVGTSSNSVNTTSSTQSKSSTDTTFKDEMSKVSDKSKSEETNDVNNEKKSNDNAASTACDDKKDKETLKSENKEMNALRTELENIQIGNEDFSISLINANNNLTQDINQMINNTMTVENVDNIWTFGYGESSKNHISMNESDAKFFINLAQNANNGQITVENVSQNASNIVNNAAETQNISQNIQVSQTLLNALNDARQNNQPIRIDFDQNISVILRIGKDGSIAANFIPGDKVVEQYLKSNIDSLRSTFDENNLPYTDLSYSHSSKRENERRRNKQQQGE